MFQMTWIEEGELKAVQCPDFARMRTLLIAMLCFDERQMPRLWDISDKNRPYLVG